MNHKRLGPQTVALASPPAVLAFASIGGKMESQGPLASYFDELEQDSFFGEKTWEKAESAMQKRVLGRYRTFCVFGNKLCPDSKFR